MVSKTDYTLIRTIADVLGFLTLSLVIVLQALFKQVLPKKYRHRKRLDGEVVLVTGSGGGLGRLLALRFARLNAKVVVWDINADGVEETVKLIKGMGGTAYGYKVDLADKDEVYRVAERTKTNVGDVSVLVNNAGVVSGQLLLDTPDYLIKRTFDVNVIAHFWTVKAFLPKMIQRDHGHIVTIASMAGHVGISKLVDYCSSKHAAVGFDEALRIELETLGIKNVRTTLICPYFIQSTGMFDNVNSRFLPTLKSNDVADRIVEAVQQEETLVTIPGALRLSLILKAMVPWAILSMFLRNLVPDAYPVHAPPVNSTKKVPEEHNKAENISSVLKQRVKEEKDL